MDDKKKKLGQVFTPEWIVHLILDRTNYNGDHILNKYVLEPGCGNGNFSVTIIERFIVTAKKKNIQMQK